MDPIAQRKQDHIAVSLSAAADFRHVRTGFDDYSFIHQALPELDLDAIDLSTTFLGHRLRAPFLIASMTGGVDKGAVINRNLAIAAQRLGLAMGLGSQRITVTHPGTLGSFQVRDLAPDVPLFGNLGAVQLNDGFGPDEVRQLVSSVGADGLFLHLNPLQEAVQPEGDRNFAGLQAKIAALCAGVPFPILAKETGCGLAGDTAAVLVAAGVSALDLSGAGGTSWSRIEGARHAAGDGENLGEVFGEWGIPTAISLRLVRETCPHIPVIASGGLRDGIAAAKAIALGADLVSLAKPLLAPALESPEAVVRAIETWLQQLRVAMFCIGAGSIAALKATTRLVTR
ncbi:MAG: type 2 isopentenyl-diphosphate Delta-isomerase [Candidatus Sericytochromatia bacterium]|nr:type 2 isopentenyl-diphosphate Delta-isomerase [Candidatus Sericytochromatia bacterium]